MRPNASKTSHISLPSVTQVFINYILLEAAVGLDNMIIIKHFLTRISPHTSCY